MGIEGQTPPIPKMCSEKLKFMWEKEGFEYEYLDWHFFSSSFDYKVYGKNGTKAGDGGNGGKQGDPGKAGKLMVFELNEVSNVKTQTNNGKSIDFDLFL